MLINDKNFKKVFREFIMEKRTITSLYECTMDMSVGLHAERVML